MQHVLVLCIGTDLAILSRCNHTILSYGTFSFWAGFLSGGKRIIPSMILSNYVSSPLDIDLDSFTMTDEGLEYEADWEKKKRLDVEHLISL